MFHPAEFAHIIQKTVGGSSQIEYLDAVEDDPQKRKPDIQRAKELLNWQPKVRCRCLGLWGGEGSDLGRGKTRAES